MTLTADPEAGADESAHAGADKPTETESIPILEGHAVRFNEYRY